MEIIWYLSDKWLPAAVTAAFDNDHELREFVDGAGKRWIVRKRGVRTVAEDAGIETDARDPFATAGLIYTHRVDREYIAVSPVAPAPWTIEGATDKTMWGTAIGRSLAMAWRSHCQYHWQDDVPALRAQFALDNMTRTSYYCAKE